MKFGQVEDPSLIDFSIPKDHISTSLVLERNKKVLKIFLWGAQNGIKQILKDSILKAQKMN